MIEGSELNAIVSFVGQSIVFENNDILDKKICATMAFHRSMFNAFQRLGSHAFKVLFIQYMYSFSKHCTYRKTKSLHI